MPTLKDSMKRSSTARKVGKMNLKQSMSCFRASRTAVLLLALLAVAVMGGVLDSAQGHSGPEQVKAFGALLGLGAGLLPTAGKLVSRALGKSASRTVARPSSVTALARRTPGSAATGLARRGALLAGGGAAFELGSRALPGGPSFPGGDFSIPSFGGGGGGAGGGVGDLQPGARFGDTFITRVWQSGMSAEGVPIIHGMLANGKRFVTNRFGTIRVFRPKKNIVIGSDPRLSDASKVARAADKMQKSAIKILDVTGKKAVKK